MAKVRALAACAVLLAGCGGSSAPEPPRGGPTLRLALPLLPRTLDPAKAADLPSLNVAHELYAGLTRFHGSGVEADLAESWEVRGGGLVWTFHLRKGIRWSDGTAIRAVDFRRSWTRALAPAMRAAYAGPALGIVRNARRFHATGRGAIGVEAPDERTLRVTLQHPVPWFDQLAAYPIAAPAPPSARAFSGPFRLVSRSTRRLVLARNPEYWNAVAVKPRRLVLTTSRADIDAVLPQGLAGPGLPWVATAARQQGAGWRRLPTLAVRLLWFVTTRPELASAYDRAAVAAQVGDATLRGLVPAAMPGREVVTSGSALVLRSRLRPLRLTLAYTTQDPGAEATVARITRVLGAKNVSIEPLPFPTLASLLRAAGPPVRPVVDVVLLGWSSKILDAYNVFDLFPCGSAFNFAGWCDRQYGSLMRRVVRVQDDEARWRLERGLLPLLRRGTPALPLGGAGDQVLLKPGVHGFSWSPVGFYELLGMTRS